MAFTSHKMAMWLAFAVLQHIHTMLMLLTVLIRPHLYYIASFFFTKRVQKNYLGLIFGVRGSIWRCTSFSFRLVFWACEDVVAGRMHGFYGAEVGLIHIF